MRHLTSLALALILAGCATAHRDVLVFATDTSFGVTVGTDPATAQLSNVSIGYRRREAVWMPLLANGLDSPLVCAQWSEVERACKQAIPRATCDGAEGSLCDGTDLPGWSPKYRGYASGPGLGRSGNRTESDTYSVFASFGGSGSGGVDGAKVELAQFFATGIAAQRLGENPRATQLVSTSEASVAGARAEGRADAMTELLDSPETIKIVAASQARDDGARKSAVECVFSADSTPASRSARLEAMAALPQRPGDKDAIRAAVTPEKLQQTLARDSLLDLATDLSTACEQATKGK